MPKSVKDLMKVLVDFQNILENKAIELRKLEVFKVVTRTSSFMDYPEDKFPAISSSLNADLSKPINNDLHCLSFSFTFFPKKNDKWVIHSELGWSSYDEGFVDYKIVEEEYENLYDMLKSINQLTLKFMKDFELLVSKIDTDNDQIARI